MQYNKSYLKWAGGKGKVLPHLLPILEKHKQTTFVEPFVGAANVSLNFDADVYLWNDLNKDLVDSHKVILGQSYLYNAYLDHCDRFFREGIDSFYKIRCRFNTRDSKGLPTIYSAMFQYLNKHGFNGLMRYNKSGGFNTSIGTNTETPKVIPLGSIKLFRDRFYNNTTIINEHFEEVFRRVELREALIMYSDPPYIPAGQSNFNYTSDGFTYKDHVKLKDLSKQSRHTCIISNHWNDITKELYKDADEVYTFPVQRTISCKGGDRKKVEECIVVYRGEDR